MFLRPVSVGAKKWLTETSLSSSKEMVSETSLKYNLRLKSKGSNRIGAVVFCPEYLAGGRVFNGCHSHLSCQKELIRTTSRLLY